MWFRNKTKNRRHNRSHVLDVKLSTNQVKAGRRRFFIWAFGLTVGTVFGLYVLYRSGDWALQRYVYGNPAFSIQKLDIVTDGVIPVERIRGWSGIKNNENLLALDLSRVRTNLQLIPLIQSVSVERVFPDKLKIRVAEREALAQVYIAYQPKASGNGHEPALYLLDETGFVMPPMEDHTQVASGPKFQEGLPILVGLNPLDVRPGRTVESGQILAALQLIQAFDRSPMAGLVDLHRMDVSQQDVIKVFTHQHSQVTFALHHLEEQLRRWRMVYDFGAGKGLTVSNLDLSVGNNVPATWFEKGAAPTPKPKVSKPSRTRRKNV